MVKRAVVGGQINALRKMTCWNKQHSNNNGSPKTKKKQEIVMLENVLKRKPNSS